MKNLTDKQVDLMLNDILNKAFSNQYLRKNNSSNNIAEFVSSWLNKNNSDVKKKNGGMM